MPRLLKFVVVIAILALVSVGLTACEKERPVSTPSKTTGTPARGTVVATSTAPVSLTQVTMPGTTGAQAGQATPLPVGIATPTAPAPQAVVINPQGQATAAPSTAFFLYNVMAGDTIASIASKYNTTAEAIAQLNNLADPNVLTLGQQLKIPSVAVEYVVQSGDTLAAIARRFNTTIGKLQELNNLSNPDVIGVGDKLLLPPGSTAVLPVATAAAGSPTQSYVVQSGDTLMRIAAKFGVTAQQIQNANNLANPDRIYPGQVLVIP